MSAKVCKNNQKYSKHLKNMTKYTKVRNTRQNQAIVCKSMQKTSQSMKKCIYLCKKNSKKFEKLCLSMNTYKKYEKCENVGKSMQK